MFSQFSEFLDSASKLTADFSLDNLQNEEADDSSKSNTIKKSESIKSTKAAEPIVQSPYHDRNSTPSRTVVESCKDDISELVEDEEKERYVVLVDELRGVVRGLESKLASEVELSQKKTEDMKDIRRQLRDEKKQAKDLRDKVRRLEDECAAAERDSSAASTRNIALEQEIQELRAILSQNVASVEPKTDLSVDAADISSTGCDRCSELQSRCEALQLAYDHLDKKFSTEKVRAEEVMSALRSEVASLEVEAERRADQEEAIEQLQQRIAGLEQQLHTSESSRLEAAAGTSGSERELRAKELEVEQLQAANARLSDEVSGLQSSLSEWKEKQSTVAGKMRDKLRGMQENLSRLEADKEGLAEALRNKVGILTDG